MTGSLLHSLQVATILATCFVSLAGASAEVDKNKPRSDSLLIQDTSDDCPIEKTLLLVVLHGYGIDAGVLVQEDRRLSTLSSSLVKVVFIAHGSKDGLISANEIKETVKFFESHRVDVTFVEYNVPPVVSSAMRQDIGTWLSKFSRLLQKTDTEE